MRTHNRNGKERQNARLFVSISIHTAHKIDTYNEYSVSAIQRSGSEFHWILMYAVCETRDTGVVAAIVRMSPFHPKFVAQHNSNISFRHSIDSMCTDCTGFIRTNVASAVWFGLPCHAFLHFSINPKFQWICRVRVQHTMTDLFPILCLSSGCVRFGCVVFSFRLSFFSQFISRHLSQFWDEPREHKPFCRK